MPRARRAALRIEPVEDIACVPTGPGTYALLLAVREELRLEVGRLGGVRLEPGFYAYVGSALGGLRGRLTRHLRAERAQHWHIDRLLSCCAPELAVLLPSDQRVECVWARAMLASGGRAGVDGFGASDCQCRTHLIRYETTDRAVADALLAAQGLADTALVLQLRPQVLRAGLVPGDFGRP